jgi:transposase
MGKAKLKPLNKLNRETLKQLSHDQLCDIVLKLVERVEDLERRLDQNSSNSSKPPSSDPPGTQREPKKPPSGRNPGGQPGHRGKFQKPFPEDRVDESKAVVPKRCDHCDHSLEGRDPNPHRHQVVELPPIQLFIREYLLHALKCRHCGKMTRGKLPKGTSARMMGPRLTALTALLSGSFRMSKREVQAFLKAVFELDIALGSVTRCEEAVTAAVEPAVKEAVAYARAQPFANMDETGWKERRKPAWLWTLDTALVAVYRIDARRSGEAMKELLGDFAGVLGSDRYGAYTAYPRRRQLCWAHLLRDFEAIRAMRGKPGGIGRRLLSRARRIFILWHRVKANKLSRKKFRNRLVYHQLKFEGLLREGANLVHGKKIRNTCRRILKLRKSLWTFAQIKGVEPTNNAAERALRPAVLWRKGSFGTHSPLGSKFAESILTVRATLKKQGRDLFGFLTQACQATLSGAKAPSLLPT